MNKLKLALVGCGDVAQRYYLPDLHRLERAELAAVCDRIEERARSVAEQYGAPAWYTDYAEMLADSAADIVVNLTPVQFHAQATYAALQAGKHVFTKKPVATTVRDARHLQEEARRRGLTMVCAPCVGLPDER